MRTMLLTLGCLLLCVTPVAAQSLPPPDEIAAVVERIGGVQNAIQLLFMVLLLAAVWRLGKPVLDGNRDANQRATAAQEALLRRVEREDAIEQQRETVRQQTAASLERAANILSGMETQEQAQQGRKGAVQQINQHTDDAQKETRELITGVEKRVNTALEGLGKTSKSIEEKLGAWDDTIRIHLNEVRGELTEIKHALDKAKGDTGELNRANLPDTDPAASKDIWSGDTPDISQRPEGKPDAPES